MKSNNSEWTTIIKAKTGWFDIDLKELFHYRDLISLFVKRDFVAYYQQSVLGPLWYLIQPLLTVVVFTIVFSKIAKIPTDGIPETVFYMAGLVIWNYFASCMTSTSNVFVANSGIFGKVYFPRMAVPISVIISNFIRFLIQFLLFIGFYIFYLISGSNIHPNIHLLYVPLLILQSAFLGFGFGILISSLTTKYRDLGFLVGFGIQLWMYATPIAYPLSQITGKWRLIFLINPMTTVIETFRFSFFGVGQMNFSNLIISGVTTLIIIFLGIILFSRVEKSFMDRV